MTPAPAPTPALHTGPAPRLRRVAALMALALASGLASAADTGPPAATNDPLAAARTHIAAKKWVDALTELRRINDPTSAHWNNLMGYSLRKQGTPDLDGSEKFYREAIRIDAKHRGAHEYLGELFLMKGDLKSAESELAVLDRLCTLPCEEYTDLKKAVERFKANGNKYQP